MEGSDPKSFCDWFYGWLLEKRKLHSAYRALCKKIDAGECAGLESQISYFENYLANIVNSARSEFISDTPKESLLQDSETDKPKISASQDSSEKRDDDKKRLQDASEQLSPQLRVPFVLKYYQVFGCPNETDIAYISSETGRPEDEIVEAIETEAQQSQGNTYPLSSAFIGDLLGLYPSPGSGYAAVDQRTRRALHRIKELLQQKNEED